VNEHPNAQAAGSFMIVLLALALHWVARRVRPVSVYRQTIDLVASYLVLVALVRLVILAGWLTQVEARIINGLLAGVYAATIVAVLLVAERAAQAAARKPPPVPRFPLDRNGPPEGGAGTRMAA